MSFAAIAVLMNRQKNLMIFSFTIFPSNPKKKRKKDTNNNLSVLNHFSILFQNTSKFNLIVIPSEPRLFLFFISLRAFNPDAVTVPSICFAEDQLLCVYVESFTFSLGKHTAANKRQNMITII